MREFQVIEVKSLWLRLYGKVWRFRYRFFANIRRAKAKAKYHAWTSENKPRIYRVIIR